MLLAGACAIPTTIDTLGDRSPPPEFGRPGWVRTCAGVGGWLGGVVGGVASIVLLPVTYPISLLADDGLGEQASGEFVLFPAVGLAAVGHCALGFPADLVDWTFRRAWVDGDDPVAAYDFVPLDGPEVPKVRPQAAGDPEREAPEGGESPR